MSLNDNDSPTRGTFPQVQDAHGQAALLLVESLIHGLREQSVLSASQAVAIVERAVEVQAELAASANGAAAPMWRSHSLLSSIARSLRADGGPDLLAPR